MALFGRIRKRHLGLIECSDIAPERPYSVQDLGGIDGIFHCAFKYGHTEGLGTLALSVIEANPYLSDAQNKARELNGKAAKALEELSKCVEAITLPEGVAESAGGFHLVSNGRIVVQIEKIGANKLDESGTLYLDADKLYPLNKENFGRVQGLYKEMTDAAEGTRELAKTVANDLRPAMADAIKEYTVKTIRDIPWYSLNAWGKRRRIRFGTWRRVFNGVQNYEIGSMVPVFSYDPKFDHFNDAIENARKMREPEPEPGDTAIEVTGIEVEETEAGKPVKETGQTQPLNGT